MTKKLKLCDVHSFSTSTNSPHHTTVLNANYQNWWKFETNLHILLRHGVETV